ncbi:MAG: hypothetical protein ABIP95_10625 [Pelobium sp.]
MKFKSVGTVKPIEFTFGFQHQKGAFVWYKGKNVPIPLKLKSLDIDSSERESGQPDFHSYKYTEMYNGKATGEYGITEWPRNVADIYYIRYKDGKKFKFELIDEKETYDGKDMALLHDVQIRYYVFYEDNLTFTYSDKYQEKFVLSKLDKDNARHLQINDYNFDGVDDIAFGIDIFIGHKVVLDTQEIFLYNSKNKRFKKLSIPKTAGSNYFNDLKVDYKHKTITTKSKIGNTWKSFTYKFDKMGKLVLVK